MQDGVVVCQHGVLETDLDGEDAWEQRVDCFEDSRETFAEGVVCAIVHLEVSVWIHCSERLGGSTSWALTSSCSVFAMLALSRSDRLGFFA